MSQFSYSPSYRRNLPHLQPRGAVIFVTFRLSGTLPRALVERHRLEQKWLSHLADTNPTYHELVAQQFERRWFAKFEAVLDGATIGPTWLRDNRLAAVLEESLHFRHDSVYRLDAFSIRARRVGPFGVVYGLRPSGEDPFLVIQQLVSAFGWHRHRLRACDR